MMKKTQLFLAAVLCLICLFDTQAQDWSTGGNSVSNNHFLGTTGNNQDLHFAVRSQFAGKFRGGLLTDDELGYFGVGLWNNYADDPQERLHVKDGYVLFEGLDNFETAGDESRIYLGNTNYVFKSIKGTGIGIDIEGKDDAISILNTSGYVGIGLTNPSVALEVNGDIKADNITMSSSGVLTVNEIKTGKLVPLDGDSIITIGDSTIHFDDNWNRIYVSQSGVTKGISVGGKTSRALGSNSVVIGENSQAISANSVAIGTNVIVRSDATNSIGIGYGFNTTSGRFINTEPNSLMVGFNSDVSTLTVTGGDGTTGSIGKVGIGTTDPKELLQIGELFTFHSGGTKKIARNMYFDGTDKSIEAGKVACFGMDVNGDFAFRTSNATGANETLTWTEAMWIKNDGTVGINTSTPNQAYSLDVNGSLNADEIYLNGTPISNNLTLWNEGAGVGGIVYNDQEEIRIGTMNEFITVNGTPSKSRVGIEAKSTDDVALLIKSTNSTAFSYGILQEVNNNSIKAYEIFNTATGKSNFKINGDGNVFARGVWLTLTDFPDYVFEDDYELMPLDELEAYINENGKLPEMPSAEEVKQGGMNVAEVQKLLVQKVEELTLHLIELKKENEELKNRVDSITK